jgi:hypothetical protein
MESEQEGMVVENLYLGGT